MALVRVVLDTREHQLLAHPVFALPTTVPTVPSSSVAVCVEHATLDVGDLQIWVKTETAAVPDVDAGESDPPWVPWLVYERKTRSDLESSLNTGRYAEQRERLKAWASTFACPPRIVYLIEDFGDADAPHNARLQAVLLSLTAVHRASVVHTRSLDATALHLEGASAALAKRVGAGTLPRADGGASVASHERASCRGVAYRKSANLTSAHQCWVRQLCCVPGIATGIAEQIARVYPSMSAFVAAVTASTDRTDRADRAAACRMLAKSVPKVGPGLAGRMLDMMMAPPPSVCVPTVGVCAQV
jgi:ERCC4-type nuclease